MRFLFSGTPRVYLIVILWLRTHTAVEKVGNGHVDWECREVKWSAVRERKYCRWLRRWDIIAGSHWLPYCLDFPCPPPLSFFFLFSVHSLILSPSSLSTHARPITPFLFLPLSRRLDAPIYGASSSCLSRGRSTTINKVPNTLSHLTIRFVSDSPDPPWHPIHLTPRRRQLSPRRSVGESRLLRPMRLPRA